MSSPRPFVAAVAGIAALCALDAAVKELTRSYSVAYAVLGRYVFGTVFALAVWWWQPQAAEIAKRDHRLGQLRLDLRILEIEPLWRIAREEAAGQRGLTRLKILLLMRDFPDGLRAFSASLNG